MKDRGSVRQSSKRVFLYKDGPNEPTPYVPAFILPAGYKAACHLHEKIILFKTINECLKHNSERHDCRRFNVL